MSFQNLDVYKKSLEFREVALKIFAQHKKLRRTLSDQLDRASLSILLNIAEGSGKNSYLDRRNFFSIARGSTFECKAVLDALLLEQIITKNEHLEYQQLLDDVSRMLYRMIVNLSNKAKNAS